MADSCQRCGAPIAHRAKASRAEREARRFCTKVCANRSREPAGPFARMMAKVHTVPESGCWLFVGATDGNGYGQVSAGRGLAPHKAHRVSFAHHFGPIPEGMNVCHRCDTPACVNPSHLFLGTQADNMRDCSNKGRINPASLMNLQPGAPGFLGAGPNRRNEDGARN